MKSISRFINFAVFILLASFTLGFAHAQTAFKIGQPAPEFKAGRWIKKGPITQLEPGQITVVEFWATWCGPCREAMPHLSEIARKHAGKVTVIGVDILEHSTGEKADKMVDRFAEQMGSNLDYNVCRDTADDYLLKNWFRPTGSPGIPTTIVVDTAGRIAWIGHPIKLDAVLDELMAGKFDYEKSAAEHTKASDSNAAMMAVFKAYREAVDAEDWAKAIKVIDDNPQYATSTWMMRFMALLHVDPAAAFTQAQEAVVKKERTASSFLSTMADTEGLPAEMYRFVVETLEKDPQPLTLGSLAKAHYQLGDSAKAVEYQQKFKDAVLALPRKPTPEAIERIDEDLKKFQAGR